MVETKNIDGKGFGILKDYNCWRIAHLGYDKESNSIEGTIKFGRHLETDEVFILLQGEAYIFTAGFEDELGKIACTKLEKDKLYSVKEKQWHVAILEPDSSILIVENKDTGDGNSNSHVATADEKNEIKRSLGYR